MSIVLISKITIHNITFLLLFFNCFLQFIQGLFPELQSEEFSIKGLKLPSQPKNSLRMPLGQKKKPTVCGKFNDSLIKLVVAMKRYVSSFPDY